MSIPSFRVGISKNKNIDQGIKETCSIMSAKVTYEIDHISLLRDSIISSVLIFCFFYVFYRNLKGKDNIQRNINSKKKKC